jgi:pimeloyl-ACP methyl ester carboxylesterase
MRGMRLIVIGLLLVLAGGGLAHFIQTAGGVEVTDVRIPLGDGKQLSGLLYAPPGASEADPAPAVLAVHGYINSRETQSGFAIEFARRGYVVLALDQTGHGFSEGPAFSAGFGGPAALAWLREQPFVDRDNIGLEGHSMGGWTVLAAATAMPDAYRSVALVGSSTGPGFAAPGTPDWPRNLGVVFSRYDEFAQLMWGVQRAADVASSAKLQGVFGVEGEVEPKRVYGSIEAGTARWLSIPNTTHPGDHLSTEAIADALTWIGMTLEGERELPASDQIWFWKEIGTLIALIGGVVLLLGAMDALLAAPWLNKAARPGAGVVERPTMVWWASLAATAAVPALTYFYVTEWGSALSGLAVFPQNVTNQILTWALANAAIALPIVFFRPQGNEGAWAQKTLVAIGSVAAVLAALALSHVLFLTDFRFWVVALKLPAAHHLPAIAAYLLPFCVFFYLTQRAFHASLSLKGPAWAQYAAAIAAVAGGMIVLVAAIYAWLFATGALPGTDPLWSVIAIQFAPVLAACAIISVFAWRRTGGALTGALTCGFLVTWYVVAGQATHVWPG